MTSNPMITKEDLRKIHLYCYEDVQEFLSIHKTLDEEIEKPEAEMDKVLIEECLKYVEVVMGEDDDIDEEKLDAKYQEIMARVEQKQPAQPAKVIKSKKHSVRKFFFILAAAITVLFTTLTIAAKICGYDNAWEFVYQKALEILELDAGNRIESDNITLIKNNDAEKFSSFGEFLEKESLDILYPQSLPNHLKIETIYKHRSADDKLNYTVEFNDKNTYFVIRNYHSVDLETITSVEICFCNNKKFLIQKNDNGTYQALCNDGNYEYTINAPDYDTLMHILRNLKGS